MQDRFETFIRETTAIYRAIQQIKSMEMTRLGLKGMHVMCIYFLYKHEEGLTAAALSDMCGEDKAAISRAIAILKDKGYVEEEQSGQTKKYRSIITLTPSGRELGKIEGEMIASAINAGGEGLDDESRSDFYASLKLIAENLRKYSEGMKGK